MSDISLTDEELVCYLVNKVSGKPLPNEEVVRECNLYEENDVREIFENYNLNNNNNNNDNNGNNKKEVYVMTRLKKKSEKDSRISRKVGSGAWQGEDSAKKVLASNGNVSALKKRFRYENISSPHNGCWIMHEFSLPRRSSVQQLSPHMDNYVICKIRKIEPGKHNVVGKKRKLQNLVREDTLPEKVEDASEELQLDRKSWSAETNKPMHTMSVEATQSDEVLNDNRDPKSETSVSGKEEREAIAEENESIKGELSDESHSDFAESFAQILLQNVQSPYLLQEPPISLLPNLFYQANWVRGWQVFSKST